MNNRINYQDRKEVYIGTQYKSTKKQQIKKNIKTNIEEDNDEPLKAAKLIPRSIGIKIQQKRQELKMSQKDLALKINEKVNVIQEIEIGNCKYNRNLLNKLERILNIKL